MQRPASPYRDGTTHVVFEPLDFMAQGSFIVDELTDLVEEQIYQEFECISERGGVLGAMDTMYQRGKIQEESLYFESKKHDGSLPIVGVNTFLPPDGHGEVGPIELMRSSAEEKDQQVANVEAFRKTHVILEPLDFIARLAAVGN